MHIIQFKFKTSWFLVGSWLTWFSSYPRMNVEVFIALLVVRVRQQLIYIRWNKIVQVLNKIKVYSFLEMEIHFVNYFVSDN